MQKIEVKSKKDLAKLGAAFLFGGGFMTLFIITAFIGIPMMLIGIILLILSPFIDPSKANRLTSWDAWKK